jgi:hypothetical protein
MYINLIALEESNLHSALNILEKLADNKEHCVEASELAK